MKNIVIIDYPDQLEEYKLPTEAEKKALDHINEKFKELRKLQYVGYLNMLVIRGGHQVCHPGGMHYNVK